jgi:hypothetical protein
MIAPKKMTDEELREKSAPEEKSFPPRLRSPLIKELHHGVAESARLRSKIEARIARVTLAFPPSDSDENQGLGWAL